MAKKIKTKIKLQIPGGQANPAPPVGPALGQHGLNIAEFCKDFKSMPAEKQVLYIPAFNGRFSKDYTKDITIPLSEEQTELLGKTGYSFLVGLGIMGVMLQLPKSITLWEEHAYKGEPLETWRKNIKAGPVVDNDSWWVNGVGHPISGAAYYTMARSTGLQPMQAFMYSALMSTFFWEYGLVQIMHL